MQAGFLALEAGCTRNKNHVNIAAKNIADFLIITCIFSIVGFYIAFDDVIHIFQSSIDLSLYTDLVSYEIAFLIFQLMFACTAITIVSGGTAERLKFIHYLIIAAIAGGIFYPIGVHWAWSSSFRADHLGWLEVIGFIDFAGSAVVHIFGGALALTLILIIGPRKDRFNKKDDYISQNNPSLSILGVLLIWIGWLGFNGGSNLVFNESVPRIIWNTLFSGAVGGITAMVISYIKNKSFDLFMICSSVIASLVAINAGCNKFTLIDVVIISIIATLIAEYASNILIKKKIDDPLNVVPCHLVCGVWGVIAVGIFIPPEELNTGNTFITQLGVQALGSLIYIFWGGVVTGCCFWIINKKYPLRVSAEDEEIGLNFSEHRISNETTRFLEKVKLHAKDDIDNVSEIQVEPMTDLYLIADAYNQVVKKFKEEKEYAINNLQALKLNLSELEETQSELAEQKKMSGLTDLMTGIAHEANTPLGVCIMAISVVDEQINQHLPNSCELSNSITLINKNLLRVKNLIESCKKITQFTESTDAFTSLDYNEFIINYSNSKKRQLSIKNIELDIHKIDKKQSENMLLKPAILMEVFDELISNTLNHAFNNEDSTKIITIHPEIKSNHLIINYSDNGKGIDNADKDKVFTPFYTTQRGKGLMGLGLNVAKNLITHGLNGAIKLVDNANFEMKFTITYEKHAANKVSTDDILF